MISAAATRVLTAMLEAEVSDELDDAEVVCDKGSCYLGLDTVSKRTVNELLRLCLVGYDDSGGAEHYTLNEEGRKMVADPEYVPIIVAALKRRKE